MLALPLPWMEQSSRMQRTWSTSMTLECLMPRSPRRMLVAVTLVHRGMAGARTLPRPQILECVTPGRRQMRRHQGQTLAT
jgi:hypothetical protein